MQPPPSPSPDEPSLTSPNPVHRPPRSLPESLIFSTFPEVSIPLTLALQGKSIPVGSWNAIGTRWPEELAGSLPERDQPVELEVGEAPIRINFSCRGRPALTGDGAPILLFEDLEPEQAELLHRIIDENLAQDPNGLLRLLELNQSKPLRQAIESKRRRQSWGTMVAATMLLGLVGWLCYIKVVTVIPRYAVVSAPSTLVSSVVAGRLEGVLPNQRQWVEAGQLLGRVISPEVSNRLDAIDHEILSIRGLISQDQSRLEEIRTLTAAMEEQQAARSETLRNRITLIEEKLSLGQAQVDRLDRLSKAVAVRTREEQLLKVMDDKTELEVLRVQMADTSFRHTLLTQGLAGAEDLRDNTTTTRLLLSRIEASLSQVARLELERRNLEARSEIIAPISGVVYRTFVQNGESVGAHMPLVTLIAAQGTLVHTLIPVEDARLLRVGDSAHAKLADGRVLKGKLGEISYETKPAGRAGLPDQIFSEERYARVDLSMPNVTSDDVGMVAQARFRSHRISGFFGW